MLAAHLQPQLETGTLAVTPGPVNDSTSEFTVEVVGHGGHSGRIDNFDPVLSNDRSLATAT